MEACGASHYWARELRALGHEVVLIPPQYVKPYVDRGKNDAADAAARLPRRGRDGETAPGRTKKRRSDEFEFGAGPILPRQRPELA